MPIASRQPPCRLSVLILAAFALFAAPACAEDSSAQASKHFSVENFRWTGRLAAGGVLEVINHFGTVRAKASDDETVILSAMIQLIGESPRRPELDIVEAEEKIRIRVRYPSAGEVPEGDPIAFGGRTDVTVLVPPGVTLRARTHDGAVKVSRMKSDVEAVTDSGKISIRTPGRVQARTRGGDISVQLSGRDFQGPMKLHSETGAVSVRLGKDAAVQIRASAGGEIRADWAPWTAVSVNDRSDGWSAELGQGGPLLELSAGGDLSIVTYERPQVQSGARAGTLPAAKRGNARDEETGPTSDRRAPTEPALPGPSAMKKGLGSTG